MSDHLYWNKLIRTIFCRDFSKLLIFYTKIKKMLEINPNLDLDTPIFYFFSEKNLDFLHQSLKKKLVKKAKIRSKIGLKIRSNLFLFPSLFFLNPAHQNYVSFRGDLWPPSKDYNNFINCGFVQRNWHRKSNILHTWSSVPNLIARYEISWDQKIRSNLELPT